MAQLIVAGVPQPVYRRNKGYSVAIPGWNILFSHSQKDKSDLKTCWADVMVHSHARPNDGTHIVAFHQVESERKQFEKAIWQRHRLIWLPQKLLRVYGTQEFTEVLQEIAEFETAWRTTIRPRNARSALLLPEQAFEVASGVQPVWTRAQTIRAGKDRLDAVVGLIKYFKQSYYQSGEWVDLRDRKFAVAKAKHAIHVPDDHCWKFTYEVEPGFHYDVTSRRGSFRIRDAGGSTKSFRRHTNIDCHGHVRSGS